MKIKKIKNILYDLYYRGIYDGIDIGEGQYDRFLGNHEARRKSEYTT